MESSYHKRLPLTIRTRKSTFQRMKKSTEELPIDVQPVHLKPVFGMEPPVYLTVIYILLFLLILFLVAFLPGILKSGKRVTFTSDVMPSAVYLDDTYVGSAPVTVFVEPGAHEVRFSFLDTMEHTTSFQVSRPVFLTWLFPRKQEVSSDTFINNLPAFRDYLEAMFDQVVAWSVPSIDERYHRPPLFSHVSHTVERMQVDGAEEPLKQFFISAAVHMQSIGMVDEAREALQQVADAGQLSVSAAKTVESMLTQAEHVLNGEKDGSIGLERHAEQPSFTRTALPVPLDGFSTVTGFRYTGGQFVKGQSTVRSYPELNAMGVETTVGEFSIASLETTEYQWAKFIEANPYWAKNNLERLIADGVVDEQYLAGIFPTVSVMSNRPIRNISWYAATAYADWLGKVTGKAVSLPTESQWEFAAASVESKPYQTATVAMTDSNGPSAMLGGYWEFTADDYLPLARLFGEVSPWHSPQSGVIVKGGSYLNDPQQIGRTTVGVLSRSECSDTAGFRVAWVD